MQGGEARVCRRARDVRVDLNGKGKRELWGVGVHLGKGEKREMNETILQEEPCKER